MLNRILLAAVALMVTACAPSLRTYPMAGQPVPDAADRVSIDRLHGPSASPAVPGVDDTGGDVALAGSDDSGIEEFEGEGPRWDIDVTSYETHERVEHYVRLFSGTARERIAERLGRGTQYEPMIRARLREAGLPEDMYYLALIESGFDVHAYSRAAAVGMWQFMTATGRGMGLRIDWWVDERRDPVRSTDAAVRFLSGLRNQFGSLYLAAAAYNGGPGRISRGLQRFSSDLEGTEGDDLFFALTGRSYLHRETEDYVPQLIAAAIVGKEPHRFGMNVETREPFAYDSVSVPAATPLAAVAAAAGIDLPTVRDLNPHLLRGLTPLQGSYFVRVPVGAAEDFDARWAEMPEEERRGVRRVNVAKVVSIANLAAQQKVTARQLTTYNPGLKRTPKGNIAAGQTVLIPTAETLRGSRDVPDPAIERYGSTSRPTAARTHTVKKGETLSHIARAHGTTVAQLMTLNRLSKPTIFPGQVLVVAGRRS